MYHLVIHYLLIVHSIKQKINSIIIEEIINYEKKKIIPLTTEEKIHYNEQEICYICKKEFDKSDKKHYKVRDHCHYTGKYRGAAHNICNLRYKIPKEIPVVLQSGSTYDYHFIIKELKN